MHGTNAGTAAGWDYARSPFARRCPGWIPPGAQTSAAPSGPAPPESPQACDSKLGPPPFSGPRIEADRPVALCSTYRADPQRPVEAANRYSSSRSQPTMCPSEPGWSCSGPGQVVTYRTHELAREQSELLKYLYGEVEKTALSERAGNQARTDLLRCGICV